MKFSMAIPVGDITPGEFQNFEAIREMALALEQAGASACYLTDHPAPSAEWLHSAGLGHDALDPFAALAFIAAVSTRLMLQTNIVVLPYRNPFITAKAAATVHVLSGGRLIMGAAPGYQKAEFAALGIDFHKRGVLTDEALDTIRLAWAGGAVIMEGRGFNATGNEPRPALNPPPPIWIGGASDAAIKRAARAGDGWCPFFSDPRQSKLNQESGLQSVANLVERLEEIRGLREEQGRSGAFDVELSPREQPGFGGPTSVQPYLDAVGELIEAGVTWIGVSPPHSTRTEYIENVQWFGEEVIAKVSSATTA